MGSNRSDKELAAVVVEAISSEPQIDNERILKIGGLVAKAHSLGSQIGGVLLTFVPAAIGAVAGKLSNKFSASTGFVWGAIGGVALTVAQIIAGSSRIATSEKFKKSQAAKDFHDTVMRMAETEVASMKEIAAIHGKYTQKVTDSRIAAANEIKTL